MIRFRCSERSRKILLNYIENDSKGCSIHTEETGTSVSKSNWGTGSDIEFYNLFNDYYFKDFYNFFYEVSQRHFKLYNVWYQVYNPNSGDTHQFHDHDGMDYSGVFYLELSDQEVVTQFIVEDNIIQPVAEQGDTIVFDAKVIHRSPPNNTDHRKTIISFNIIMDT